MEKSNEFTAAHQPTAQSPLMGLTVLLVEDSRFACEAVRLLCLRSGARIRRADSLASARKHLAVYRPAVLIADIGLPDGSGLELLRSLTNAVPRIDVILGTSGDTDAEAAVLATGANGFLPKPIASLDVFQSAILAHLPASRQPPGPRLLRDERVVPDMVAFHDDLSHVAEVLRSADDDMSVDYVAQFLGGVARSVDDAGLSSAVAQLVKLRCDGSPVRPGIAALSQLVEKRLATGTLI
jgi:CheY-like chemotaxis protein